MRSRDKFRLHCGIRFVEKSGPDGEPLKGIAGVITTDKRDLQNEVLVQDGLDFSHFLSSGFFNADHGKSGSHILGWPDKDSLISFKAGETLPDGSQATQNGHWVEGYLIPGDPEAEAIWRKGKALQSAKADRNLGFSVEGEALARDPADPSRILRAKVRHVAITPNPVNTDTQLFSKSKTELAVSEMDLIAKSLFGITMDLTEQMPEESDDHFRLRTQHRQSFTPEDHQKLFGSFLAKAQEYYEEDDDDPEEEDEDKLEPEDLAKAIETLNEVLEETRPQSRLDELLKGAAHGSLNPDEAMELAHLAAGGKEHSLGQAAGLPIEKSLGTNEELKSAMEGVQAAVHLLGDHLSESENDRYRFEKAFTKVVSGLVEITKSISEHQKNILDNLKSQMGVPVHPFGAGTQTPGAVPQTPGYIGKSMGLPPGQKDPHVLAALEDMLRKSTTGEYGRGPALAENGQDISRAIATYESMGIIDERLAEEVLRYTRTKGGDQR